MMDSSETRIGTTTTTSLFICFTSSRRSSSSSCSSMKISSKSIPSPGRAGGVPTSLSTSLSRRLKTNGSLKGGGHSPMFPPAGGGGGGKRRGYENPEPSSPKVTCIGQVRVKTKKQGNKIRTLSRRRSTDFRRGGGGKKKTTTSSRGNKNQRWVHLPLTICEALRKKGFGAELVSCLFPCRRPPSCLKWGGKGEKERERERGRKGSCGVVLVALTEGGEEGGEVREEVEEERREICERISLRRHADDDEEEEEEEEDEEVEMIGEDEKCEKGRRMSFCVPPKNALLLMRSRSDPVRVSALATRFWEVGSPAAAGKCEEEGDDNNNEDEEDDAIVEEGEVLKVGLDPLGLFVGLKHEEPENLGLIEFSKEGEEEENPEPEVGMEVEEGKVEENPEEGKLGINEELWQEEADEVGNQEVEAEEANQELEENQEAVKADPENFEAESTLLIQEEGEQEDAQVSSVLSVHIHSEEEEEEKTEESTLNEEEKAEEEKIETQDSPLKVELEEQEEMLTQERSESEKTQKESKEREEEEEERPSNLERESKVSPLLLPDCLLLMNCEPKLSMEVSKETWVCTTDFIRCLPERQPEKTDGGGGEPEEEKRKRVSTESVIPAAQLFQQPRSSSSLPAGAAVAGRVSVSTRMTEQRLVNAAVAFEPLVLTRCKSEPNRTAAAKLKPETCFWKLEPHRRATVGVGAAGVGF